MSSPFDDRVSAPPRWLTLVVLGVGGLAFLPTLGGGFLSDDFVYIARFRELPWREWPRLFVQDWSEGVWGIKLRELRPFAALSFMGDARWFGGHALGYRLTNLALHLLATFFVVRLTWLHASDRGREKTREDAAPPAATDSTRAAMTAATLVAGLVFALHPAHAEAVGWITGRVDLQATAAALLFWLGAEAFARYGGVFRLGLVLVAFFVGVFSKELCLFAPLLLLLRWLLLDGRVGRQIWLRRAAVMIGVAALLVFYGACRRAAFGHDVVGNPWNDAQAWQRQADYLGWLFPVLPFAEHVEWRRYPSLATAHLIWLGLALLVAAGFVFALWRGYRRAGNVLFFAGLWYFVTVFPLTAVGYFSPRHLYFPTVGLAIGVGLAVACLPRWRSLGGALLIGGCVVAHGFAINPWRANGIISRDALAALDRELAAAGPEAIALTAVPEAHRSVWLWAWSSPESMRPPFLVHPPAKVIERPVNYSRLDRWSQDRQPLETVRAAPAAVALFVGEDGRVRCRRVSRAELQLRAEDLAKIAAAGITPESWSEWVRSLAQP